MEKWTDWEDLFKEDENYEPIETRGKVPPFPKQLPSMM